MKPARQLFASYLGSRGLRLTRERREILGEIMKIHGHFEVEDIYMRLRKKNIKVSQTSIYRTLPLLVESGIVRKTPCDRMKARYEHVLGHRHHDHMVCLKCGRILEFNNERIEQLQKEVGKKYSFEILGHRLVLSGVCEKCRQAVSESAGKRAADIRDIHADILKKAEDK